MNDPLALLTQELSKFSPRIRYEFQDKWGRAEKRGHIRESIAATLVEIEADEFEWLLDLNEPPRPFNWSVSISHTKGLGGWVAIPRPMQIGWDIEASDRIQLKVIERVCHQDEITMAPKARFLWCAKEAFFKALEDDQPQTISELTITDWKHTAPSVWAWTGIGPRNGSGILVEIDPWIAATCIVL